MKISLKKIIIMLAAMIFTCVIYFSTASAEWKLDTNELSDKITSIEYFNSLYVALGESGVLKTSKDGVSWDVRLYNKGFNNCLVKVNDTLVALVGHSFFSTKDGINWTKVSDIRSDMELNTIAYNGKIFSAIAYNKFYYSKDLKSWKLAKDARYEWETWDKVIWGGDKFVASGAHKSATSTDGIKWKIVDNIFSGNRPLSDIIWTGKSYISYVMSSNNDGVDYYINILQSSDGLKWSKCSTIPDKLDSVHADSGKLRYINNTLFLGGLARVYYSKDFKNWRISQLDEKDGFTTVNDFAYNGKTYIAAGGPGKDILTSVDGVNWCRTSSGNNRQYQSVATNGKTIVLIERINIYSWDSPSKIIAKTNGKYEERYFVEENTNLNEIIYENGKFVIVGDKGLILVSNDGLEWTKAESGVDAQIDITDVTWDGKYFAAFSKEGILRSKDAINWDYFPLDSYALACDAGYDELKFLCRQFVYFKGKYYIFRYNDWGGNIELSSENLVDWKITDMEVPAFGADINVIKDELILLTRSGSVYSTKDMKTWTYKSTHKITENSTRKMSYNGTYYVCTSGWNSTLYISKDLKKWTEVDFEILGGGMDGEIMDIASDGDNFVGVGYNGIVLTGKP